MTTLKYLGSIPTLRYRLQLLRLTLFVKPSWHYCQETLEEVECQLNLLSNKKLNKFFKNCQSLSTLIRQLKNILFFTNNQ